MISLWCTVILLHGITFVVAATPGGLTVWGSDTLGPPYYVLSNGQANQSTPVDVNFGSGAAPADGFRSVCSGEGFTIALSDAGRMYAWGFCTGYGCLGDGSRQSGAHPILAWDPSGGVQKIACGTHHVVALAGKDVFCWGLNNRGQLGSQTPGVLPFSGTPLKVIWGMYPPQQGINSIGAYGDNSGIIDGLQTVFLWGDNSFGQIQYRQAPPFYNTPNYISGIGSPSMIGIIALTGGTGFTAVLGTDKNVYMWGLNTLGQLGQGNYNNVTVATVVPEFASTPTILMIAGGCDFMLASDKNVVYTWGSNVYGQLGQGSNAPSSSSPSAVLWGGTTPQGISSMAGAKATGSVIDGTGMVFAWGTNVFLTLGTTAASGPVSFMLQSGGLAISCGPYHVVAIATLGSPSPSPSETTSPSVTRSVTPTPSTSPSMTPTSTPSRSLSSTPTRTPSTTPSVTPSVTPSETATPSVTPSVTPTSSVTPSTTTTPSRTTTPSVTPTRSGTPSRSPLSASPTRTPTSSVSPSTTRTPSTTPSLSHSSTSSPTSTVSRTPSPSISRTPSSTPSLSHSSTSSPTSTVSRTPSQSVSTSPTKSPTSSVSSSPSKSISESTTHTASESGTPSLSATPSCSPSVSASPASATTTPVIAAFVAPPHKELIAIAVGVSLGGVALCAVAIVVFMRWRRQGSKDLKKPPEVPEGLPPLPELDVSSGPAINEGPALLVVNEMFDFPGMRSPQLLVTDLPSPGGTSTMPSPGGVSSASGLTSPGMPSHGLPGYHGLKSPAQRLPSRVVSPRSRAPEPKTLFISYGRSPRITPLARQLKAELISCGYTVWMDEEGVTVGSNFMEIIGSAIQRCEGIVALIDKKYCESDFCKNELHLAHAEGKALFPCMMEHVKLPPAMKYLLVVVNYTRFNTQPFEAARAALVAGLERERISRMWSRETHWSYPLLTRWAILTLLSLTRQETEVARVQPQPRLLLQLCSAVADAL